MSALAMIPDTDRERGLHHLRGDLESGEWHRRWDYLLAQEELDLGYQVLAARP